jgi:multiple sugar transport system substrate-binding protein
MRRISDGGGMFPGVDSLDDDQMRAYFSEGKLGFITGGSWNVGVLYDQFPFKGGPDGWDVMPIPVADTNKAFGNIAGAGASYCVSAQVKKKGLEAQVGEVLKVICGDELWSLLYTNAKNLPFRQDIVTKAGVPQRAQWTSYVKSNPVVVPLPTLPNNFITPEGMEFGAVFSQIITGQAQARTALADLDRRYNAALDRAIADGTIKKETFIDPSVEQRFRTK